MDPTGCLLYSMIAAIIVAVTGIVLLALFAFRSSSRWSENLNFRPTESMQAGEIFCCLLSANLALRYGENFNQLRSSLSQRYARRLLGRRFNVVGVDAYLRLIRRRLGLLGRLSADEADAFNCYREGAQSSSSTYRKLAFACEHLLARDSVADPAGIGDVHLSMLAMDAQSVTYLIRLGIAANFISRDAAQLALLRIRRRVLQRYTAWDDYCLSALIGFAVRGGTEIANQEEWLQLLDAKAAFLGASESLLSHGDVWNDQPHHGTKRGMGPKQTLERFRSNASENSLSDTSFCDAAPL